jgi:hypothetical protein
VSKNLTPKEPLKAPVLRVAKTQLSETPLMQSRDKDSKNPRLKPMKK